MQHRTMIFHRNSLQRSRSTKTSAVLRIQFKSDSTCAFNSNRIQDFNAPNMAMIHIEFTRHSSSQAAKCANLWNLTSTVHHSIASNQHNVPGVDTNRQSGHIDGPHHLTIVAQLSTGRSFGQLGAAVWCVQKEHRATPGRPCDPVWPVERWLWRRQQPALSSPHCHCHRHLSRTTRYERERATERSQEGGQDWGGRRMASGAEAARSAVSAGTAELPAPSAAGRGSAGGCRLL